MSIKQVDHALEIILEGNVKVLDNLDKSTKDKVTHVVNFLYENKVMNICDYDNIKNFKNALDSSMIQEKAMDMSPSIKLNMDADGNLLITKKEDANLHTIFHNSHLLLKEYEKVKNIEGIKYELCKIYMIASIINNKYVHSKSILVSNTKKREMTQLKSFIMNDFYKYIRLVLAQDSNFNFNDYYSQTSFGIETYKIDNKVLKGLRQIIF